MLCLVPHSSHLTQPLDLGIFGQVKNAVRNEATYLMKVEGDDVDDGLDTVVDEEEEVEENSMADPDPDAAQTEDVDESSDDPDDFEEPRRRRAERSKALADYMLALLDAYERATTRRRVVSAFGQAGIFYKSPDPPPAPTAGCLRQSA